jgi:CRP-like cAMP-binding protein
MADPRHHPLLVRNGLLAALPPEDFARMRPALRPVELRFGETLFDAGGAVEAVLFVESGMVSLLARVENGERVEVGLSGREGLVGLPLVLGDDRSLIAARVQMEGAALRIGAAPLRAAMEASPALRGLLLRYALAFQAQVTMTAACNAHHAVERRLARWLLGAHDRAGADEFAMTHEFLSMMLGVRRPGVSVAAGTLREAGLIRLGRGRVAVTDRLGLEAASCGCYRITRDESDRLLGPGTASPPG